MDRFKRFLAGRHPSPLELVVGPEQHAYELWRGGLSFIGMIIVTTTLGIVLPGAPLPGLRTGGIWAIAGAGCLVLLIGGLFGRNWPPVAYQSLIVFLAPATMAAIWLAGPNVEVSVAVIPASVAVGFTYHPRRVAIFLSVEIFVLYGIMLGVADGYPRPFSRWVIVLGFSAAAVTILELLFQRLRVLADRDRAHAEELRIAHAQLAAANAQLEGQVTQQGSEIERLGQLRRFLTPQIAESVLSGDADSLLSTHRKRIAVFFCDLRGFTRFSASSEPEDIAEVLSEYYDVLGHAIEAHGATVGGFSGDGIFAFFNDPFPVDDPAGKAFAMALSLREPMRAMRDTWKSRGFSLGYGLGIAYGYATMSTIGFETRSEYTAVGSVVNLGARLCDAAAPGELLIDARAYSELPQDVAGEPVSLMLKGFNDPVTAYRVLL